MLTVRMGAYPARDPSLKADVPAAAEVHRTSAWDPYRVYALLTGQSSAEAVVQGSVKGREATWKERLARWVRANVFLPDARVGWVPFAVWRGWRLLSNRRFDAILTTGPPHSTHLAGAALQTATETSWLADFRDPWTDINYYQELPHTSLARSIDHTLERTVLARADAVTTVSPTWQDLLAAKVDRGGENSFEVVHNGYDEADLERRTEPIDDDIFTLTHVGSLYASRNPVGLWRALEYLRDENSIPRLRIQLVGQVDPPVQHALGTHGLDEITESVSYVPHEEAVGYMQRAGLLLLSIEEFPAARGMITGKVYEYLASGRPVLGVGPPKGDAAALLERTNGGRLFGWGDVQGMTAFVKRHYRAWGDGTASVGAPASAVQPYRRSVQTERLARVLSSLRS